MREEFEAVDVGESSGDQDSQKYLEFLEKFKGKRTTDDCFTPPAVFDAVKDWVINEYGLHGLRIVRPFMPNCDYQSFDYQSNDVVIDNPPFSIITQIRKWYDSRGVRYFLFAPALTTFGIDAPCSIIVNESVEYANGAKVNTSFVTNLDPNKVRTAPDLKAAIRDAVTGAKPEPLPKYDYPQNVISSARLGRIADVEFMVPRNRASNRIGALDSQKALKKSIFGYGLLISDGCAAELKAAELKAAELKAAELKAAELKAAELKAARESVVWALSDREIDVIKELSR